MIQTHYVPLERPYRIIYTGGKIGLQIGTLIVTEFSKGIPDRNGDINYALGHVYTRTHPVVSYVNKTYSQKLNFVVSDMMFGGTFSEAVVWDKVDQQDVATVCMEGQKILWDDFLNILTPLISECRDETITREKLIEARHFVTTLEQLGGSIELPEGYGAMTNYFGEEEAIEFQIQLQRMPYDIKGGESKELCFCSEYGFELPFVARTDDSELAFKILRRQKLFYRSLMVNLLHTKPLRFYFEPGGCCEDEADPDVVALVNKLNDYNDASSSSSSE